MTYCYRCTVCGRQMEWHERRDDIICPSHTQMPPYKSTMVRDYRAESAGIQTFTSALGDGKIETKIVNP